MTMRPSHAARGVALALLAWGLVGHPAPAQTPPAQQGAAPAQPAEPFGQEVVLPARTMVYLEGSANWEEALETLVDAFKSVHGYVARHGLAPTGRPMTIYTRTDDTGFDYQAAVPVAAAPRPPPRGDIRVGPAPSGKALKFAYRGAYDAMDTAYEAVTNYLDAKRIEAGDIFIEEYQKDLTATAADQLDVVIYVPTK